MVYLKEFKQSHALSVILVKINPSGGGNTCVPPILK